MEPRARTSHGAGRIRSLNEPRPAGVTSGEDGAPLSFGGTPVASIEETWRVDEGWWRDDALSRCYWRVQLAGGRIVTVCQDMASGQWYEQRY